MDLTKMVEEARLTGRIHGAIKSTFLALIPKKKVIFCLMITYPYHCVIVYIK